MRTSLVPICFSANNLIFLIAVGARRLKALRDGRRAMRCERQWGFFFARRRFVSLRFAATQPNNATSHAAAAHAHRHQTSQTCTRRLARPVQPASANKKSALATRLERRATRHRGPRAGVTRRRREQPTAARSLAQCSAVPLASTPDASLRASVVGEQRQKKNEKNLADAAQRAGDANAVARTPQIAHRTTHTTTWTTYVFDTFLARLIVNSRVL